MRPNNRPSKRLPLTPNPKRSRNPKPPSFRLSPPCRWSLRRCQSRSLRMRLPSGRPSRRRPKLCSSRSNRSCRSAAGVCGRVRAVAGPRAGAGSRSGRRPRRLIHDDDHDTADGDPLAYALTLPDSEATPTPATRAEASSDDLATRTESARHRADSLPPPAFAQLTPFDVATPVPPRFADVETPLPAELRHSESVVVPQPPPVKIDSRAGSPSGCRGA
ncbi:MAG: hypothetical protein GAK41_00373 [Burkholderia gladioli]|nr:MAG: hypothetical protein GAK41_00373 [Burkholderia gladioli]